MKVAMIGLGKLGLPVSCAMVLKGHEVFGYDADGDLVGRYRAGESHLHEPNMDAVLLDCLDRGLHLSHTVEQAVAPVDIVFIAVPTPSLPDYSFDTSYVKGALASVTSTLPAGKTIAVISTVLPTTTRAEFLPLTPAHRLCYNAHFIAMGTVIQDALHPEFVLIGEHDRSADALAAFYTQFTTAPILRMSYESAEVVKMVYNTFVGFKINFANTVLELCDKLAHADCDIVSDALRHATDRLISGRYLDGGLGDGGSCHPRDQRALSYLAVALDLSTDPFAYITQARIDQTDYIAGIVAEEHARSGFPVVALGLTFKPNTNLIDDSPAILLIERIQALGIPVTTYDPIVRPVLPPSIPHVYVISMRHTELKHFPFHLGSIIVDPWRLLKTAPHDCTLRSIGSASRG